jgi:cell shape-determining protein MreC
MPAIVKKVQQLEKENEQLKKMLALGVNYERANG